MNEASTDDSRPTSACSMSHIAETLFDSMNSVEKRVSQYENLLRKFSEAHQKQCRTLSLDIPKVPRSEKQFPTGSKYEGTWDILGMSGKGVYTFPNGVIYRGEFYEGLFHGNGELQYPDGITIKGKFRNGSMTERTLVFADGLEYSDVDWQYCRMPDRRFTLEYDQGLKAAGESNMTADLPTREIPQGYYDTGDGFYNPDTKVVCKSDDLTAIIRIPGEREQKWILQNCRFGAVEQIGPHPDLYEEWVEPEVDSRTDPLPAAVSRATAHLYETAIESEFPQMEDDSDSDVLEDWSKVLYEDSQISDRRKRPRYTSYQFQDVDKILKGFKS